MINSSQFSRSECERIFSEDVPYKFALDIPRVIQDAFTLAFIGGTDHIPEARKDKYPIDRRANIETGLFTLPDRYKSLGIIAQERKNSSGNASHIELIMGRVVIIPAAVRTSKTLVRKAGYRNSLAQNPQFALKGMGISIPDPSEALLAVVLYGPSNSYSIDASETKPSFVVVKFPASDWSCYVEGRIDLLAHLGFAERSETPPLGIALWPEEEAL